MSESNRLKFWMAFGVEEAAINASSVAAISAGVWLVAKGGLPAPIGLVLIFSGAALGLIDVRRRARLQESIFALSNDFGCETHSSRTGLSQIRSLSAALKHRLSNTNPVTGLPTRERLIERIGDHLKAKVEVGLLGAIRWADFDRIASFDLNAANEALSFFALRLERAIARDHVFAQIDRDCFAIWMSGAEDLATLRAQLRAVCFVAYQEMNVEVGILTPSVEVSSVSYPADGSDASQLLLRVTAGLARPLASRCAVGDTPLSLQTAREEFKLEQDLAQAIAENQLTMVFQPVIDLSRGRVIGAEALLRWDHPTLGSVSPARFIPIVEATGLSDQYGLWVLNAACREARIWKTQGLDDLKVAVNLSARQLLEPELRLKIARTLQRHKLQANALELELTETAAMVDAERTFQLFQDLRAMGVSLAIDDFGSGYSSLSYLKNLPFDKLKIDREFVTNIDTRRDSRAICKSLIELGRGLNITVLAEGVEREVEVATLKELGCSVFQGYHFAKPLKAEDFRAFIRNFATSPEQTTFHPNQAKNRRSA